jgi:hypothetical protein
LVALRWKRWSLVGLLPVLGLGGWGALHRVPGLAPVAAQAARLLFGVRSVSLMEDIAYDLDDRYNRVARAGDLPEAYWDVPATTAAPASTPASTAAPGSSSPSAPPVPHAHDGPIHPSGSISTSSPASTSPRIRIARRRSSVPR